MKRTEVGPRRMRMVVRKMVGWEGVDQEQEQTRRKYDRWDERISFTAFRENSRYSGGGVLLERIECR
jgi:hypothetical protein